MSNYVLQICLGTYLLLSVPAALLLWIVLIISRIDDTERGHDRQRFYRIALAIWNLKNAQHGREIDLLEDAPSFYNTASSGEPLGTIERERQSSPLFYLYEKEKFVRRAPTRLPSHPIDYRHLRAVNKKGGR